MTTVRSLRTVRVTRYVTPLREGGSLPAIVEADDDGLYVLKFRGAGHGARALIAELLGAELARRLGLPVPEIVLATLERELARTEPDPEIHQLIHDSAGLNLGIDYLPGAVNFDPVAHPIADPLASRIVWFDALISNVDRTARNTNMLMWHRTPWLIDHGSSLYFHHTTGWEEDPSRPRAAFPAIRDHVLRGSARRVGDEDAPLAAMLDDATIDDVLARVPDDWLADEGQARPEVVRAAYARYFRQRLVAPRPFVEDPSGAR